ncbi:MAG: 6-bladed beta-propeller, partial [Dysgonamonadaceae bacterium]|nr:6-bladed beta-propeller [Dysgonamonadaceae bacterium]
SQQIPFKLFNKKTGKFLNNIGSYGQGPNEYLNVYDFQLDEKNNRIYLLPWQAKKILVYDLKGKSLDPIPLYTYSPKGKFKVDTQAGKVIVSILPFTGAPAVVWTQTTQGKLIHAVAPGHLSVIPDFSNEIGAFKVGNAYHFNVFTFDPRADSLYNYDSVSNKLTPIFTTNFKDSKKPIHDYCEMPNYYMGSFSEPKRISESQTVTQNQRFYIVDKKTLKGSFFKLENDFLGNVEIEWPIYSLNNEYFIRNMEPGNLSDMLEKILAENKKLSPDQKTKLTKLKNSITDNDNNYILYAKLKK